MVAQTTFPTRYHDPEYQEAHNNIHQGKLLAPLEAVLPPGIGQQDFDNAISDLTKELGHDGVFTSQSLEDYVDPYELWEVEGKRKMPSAAVCPHSIDELKAVLRIANQYGLPLWTFSRGKNLGYGGPAPRLNGSVALDLHRMNKIIEVNEQFSYAVVEPGVTFTDLYDYCRARKLKVWPSVPSLGWGSVVGNTLDRGTGFTPTATHHQNIAGLEAMLADGDLVRTGQFAIPDSPNAHLSKFSFGPSIEGLFLQSNLGVVTKLGIWLTPQPQAFMSCSFSVPALEDIALFIDIFSSLRRDGLLPNTVYCSNLIETLSMVAGPRATIWPHNDTPIPSWRLDELQRQYDVGWWSAVFGLYGPAPVIQAHFDEVKRIIALKAPQHAHRLKGELFRGDDAPDGLLDPTAVPPPYGGFFVGVPSLWSLPMTRYRLPTSDSNNSSEAGRDSSSSNGAATNTGIGAHADYSAIIPSDPASVLEWVHTAKRIYEAHGLDLFCDFFMHERHLIFVNMLVIDKSCPKQRRAADSLFRALHAAGTQRGYAKYRAHVNYMDLVAEGFSFNGHAYRRFVERIKDELDPGGVLSPGKQGIWPRRYREFREEQGKL
ncbi:uncharacterized protein HMPREF1541_02096 [Cyphellophora europaea CBS 101466]|uniref:FAD-binding PCMH-type domain-containing protein n=1 Tax=Cyphellophora europaea (strain CBS 101466) TaxID=1220924 RepID=W2S4H1_CYPE1|nr:uncharacterized protein HMPREF1541_02096 [Cyphellophora europaea CBS 101466]ETN42938.1 hypothetical protein HMPREF1541_02096 [Cyphellophora europaea CBS 101466]